MCSKIFWGTVGLIVVLTLTATASGNVRSLITGRQIANHTIGSQHLIDHSIQGHDLSTSLVASLKGARGAVGPRGPKGDTGATGETGPQGVPGISGYEQVRATSSYDGMDSKTATAMCTPGKKVLSGGVIINSPPGQHQVGVYIGDSFPVASSGSVGDAGWTAGASESAERGAVWGIEVYAICATVAP